MVRRGSRAGGVLDDGGVSRRLPLALAAPIISLACERRLNLVLQRRTSEVFGYPPCAGDQTPSLKLGGDRGNLALVAAQGSRASQLCLRRRNFQASRLWRNVMPAAAPAPDPGATFSCCADPESSSLRMSYVRADGWARGARMKSSARMPLIVFRWEIRLPDLADHSVLPDLVF